MSEIRALSYFVAQIDDLQKWREYAENVLGMMTNEAPGGGLYIKMDDRPQRMLVLQGEPDCYLASGWSLASKKAFDALVARLESLDVEYRREDHIFCLQRGVNEAVVVHDPCGNRHELTWGYLSDCAPFVSPQGVPCFLTGDMGLGHTVLPAPDFEACAAFYQDVLGFEMTDIFNFRPAPDAPPIRIHFMHCGNSRHHSLAIAEYDVPSKCVHVMVEVDSMTEVGRAHDRRIANGVALSATLGQHLNDRMTSFYMKTPSGFDLEYGWGGLQVDWDHHTAFEFTKVSIWGHDFSVSQQEQ